MYCSINAVSTSNFLSRKGGSRNEVEHIVAAKLQNIKFRNAPNMFLVTYLMNFLASHKNGFSKLKLDLAKISKYCRFFFLWNVAAEVLTYRSYKQKFRPSKLREDLQCRLTNSTILGFLVRVDRFST